MKLKKSIVQTWIKQIFQNPFNQVSWCNFCRFILQEWCYCVTVITRGTEIPYNKTDLVWLCMWVPKLFNCLHRPTTHICGILNIINACVIVNTYYNVNCLAYLQDYAYALLLIIAFFALTNFTHNLQGYFSGIWNRHTTALGPVK